MMDKRAEHLGRAIGNGEIVRRLFGLAAQHRGPCAAVLVLQLVVISMTLGGLGLIGLAIDYLRSQVEAGAPLPDWPFGLAPAEGTEPMRVLILLGSLLFLIALIRGALAYAYQVSVARLIQTRIVYPLRSRVFARLQYLSFRFFDNQSTGSIINRVTGDVQNLRMFIDGVILNTLVLVITLAVYVTYMLQIHPLLTLACLATAPLLYTLTVIFSRTVRPMYLHNRQLMDGLILKLAENVQGISVVRGFGMEQTREDDFRRANAEVRGQQQRIFWKVSVFTPSINMLNHINMIVLLGFGGWLAVRGQIPLGTGLVVFAGILQQLQNQITNIAQITNNMQQSLIGARRVFEILDAPIEIRDRADARPVSNPRGHLAFEHVYFHYERRDPVLQDIHTEIRPGEKLAILGQTGAGKSLFLSLIPRFYDPTVGVIRLDGTDLRDLQVQSLRRNIGIVFQESFLFSASVAENIAFGRPDASMEQIRRAAATARADEFIDELNNGYDTVLSESGVNLSGGQRQRLAIARAILLDPSILILDDPTAAVDSVTETEIINALDRAMEGRTNFIVAQRLSTLRRADRILVFDRGRIIQEGTHRELMKSEGPYLRIARLQLSDASSLFEEEAP